MVLKTKKITTETQRSTVKEEHVKIFYENLHTALVRFILKMASLKTDEMKLLTKNHQNINYIIQNFL